MAYFTFLYTYILPTDHQYQVVDKNIPVVELPVVNEPSPLTPIILFTELIYL